MIWRASVGIALSLAVLAAYELRFPIFSAQSIPLAERRSGDDRLRFVNISNDTQPDPSHLSQVCAVSNLTVHGIDVGPLYSAGSVRVAECMAEVIRSHEQGTHRHNQFKRCTGMNQRGGGKDHGRWEKRLVREVEPLLFPMHGGVTAQRMMRLSHQLAELCPLKLAEAASWPNGTVVAELGSGNAALLSVVAPPLPHIIGVGSDIAATLIAHGSEFYPHLSLHRAIGLPMVPSGSVTCAYSMGVVLLLEIDSVCNHIGEGLRLLEAGGRLIVHAVPMNNARVGGWSTFLPSFFANRTTAGDVFLPTCKDIGQLVARVNIIKDRRFAVYNYPSCLTIVIERNERPLHCAPHTIAAFGLTKEQFVTDIFADRKRRNVTFNMSWYRSREAALG